MPIFLNGINHWQKIGADVLTNRLRATGAVNVENPVRTAVEKGKIEELDDSD